MAPSDEQTYIMVRFASWFGGVVSVPLAWADLARLPSVPAPRRSSRTACSAA
jgi:hypothetical protein